jgi:hypothetical protein
MLCLCHFYFQNSNVIREIVILMPIVELLELPFENVILNCTDTGLLLICLISLWDVHKTSADWNMSPIR